MKFRYEFILLLFIMLSGCMQVIDAPKGSKRTIDYVPESSNSISAAQQINEAAQSLADQLAPYVSKTQAPMRIAVQKFSDKTGSASLLATSLYESFRNKLFQSTSVTFVADETMDRALKSLKANERLTAALDPDTRLGLRKQTGANAFIDGRITDSISHFQINLDLIDIETGELRGSAEYQIPKNVMYSF